MEKKFNIRIFVKSIVKETLIEAYINKNGALEDLSQEDINEILRGYIECALWTEEERLGGDSTLDLDDDEEYDYDDMDEFEKICKLKGKYDAKTFGGFIEDDIDVDSKIDAYNSIKRFILNAGDDATREAIETNGLFQLGMDIWLTRNRHGSGFFDHNYENEDILTKSAQDLGEINLIVGDDGMLHFE